LIHRVKKVIRIIFLLVVSFNAGLVFAHGSDKAGPHGGFIQMPGAFHTEVVPKGAGGIDVYLLDIDFKNASTSNSSVEIALDSQQFVRCDPVKTHFECKLPNGFDLKKKGGKLRVKATRENMKGNEALYELPLKLNP